MTRSISNHDDIIDSRDVIERIAALQAEREDYDEAENGPWDETDEGIELAALEALALECEGYVSDWKYGEALIRDTYFEDYARELAEDIGAVPKDLSWPACHIDWEAATEAIKQDYTAVDFGGITYLVRS